MDFSDVLSGFDTIVNILNVANRHSARDSYEEALRREQERIDALNRRNYEGYQDYVGRAHQNYLNYLGMFDAAQAAKIAAKNRAAETMMGYIPQMRKQLKPYLRLGRKLMRAKTGAYQAGLSGLGGMAEQYFTPQAIAQSALPSASYTTAYDPLNPVPKKED